MVTRHPRTGRQAKTWICSLLVVASACWLLPVANASAAPNFTWSGAALPGTPNWSSTANWEGGIAPSGKVGTLTFPALTSPACTAKPPTATCYNSTNNVSGLEVTEKLAIDDGVPYNISGEPITLFGGITASSVHVCETFPCFSFIGVPITLGASQTWSIAGSPNQGLGIASVTGTTDSLNVTFANQTFLGFTGNVEVGPFEATGGACIYVGFGSVGTSLNGSDHNPISLSGGAGLCAGGRGAVTAIGPLTATEARVSVGGGIAPDAILAVNGGITLASTDLKFFIDHSGTTPGTDYSQLTASGPVNLAEAHLTLQLGGEESGEKFPCGKLTPGDVDTLLTTTGSLTGTFAGIPNGTVIPFWPPSGCEVGGEELRTVKINYSATAVTATVQESAEDKRHHEEEAAAKKHQEEEAAAKKHQEEEAAAAAAKKHQEEEAVAKITKEIEEAVDKVKKEIEEIFRHLGALLTPSGPSAQIGTLLKSGVFSTSFTALQAGTAVINWYQVPPGAKLAKKAKPKPVLVASGQRSFSAAGTAKIKIKLTAAGKRLLKHAKKLKLTAKGTFTPTGKAPITATKVFVLKRR